MTASSYTTITIGCKTLTHDEWLDQYEEIGKKHNYTKEQIEEYGDIIRFIIKRVKIIDK